MIVIRVCLFLLSLALSSGAPTIKLLLLLPWQDDAYSGWGPGPDLLAAARVAVAEVNSNTHVLPEHEIEVVEARQEPCDTTVYDQGIISVTQYITTGPLAGVIGLYCSNSAMPLSLVIGHNEVDLISLIAANSPIFNDEISQFNHAWFFLGSASTYAPVMTAILDQLEWTRIAIVTVVTSTFFNGISNDLVDEINKPFSNKELVYKGDLVGLEDAVYDKVIDNIKVNGVFITFVTMSSSMANKLLCLAATENMVWPNYAWLIIETTWTEIMSAPSECSEQEMATVLEGAFFISFRLEPDDPSAFMWQSNLTYLNYLDRFSDEHENVKQEYPTASAKGDSHWAALAYDQIWAFSIALHQSLPELALKNLSIEEYGFGQPTVTHIIEDELARLDVQGAANRIKFNDFRQVASDIYILQIQSSTEVLVGVYNDHYPDNLTITLAEEPPKDTVTAELVVLPLSVTVVVFVASAVLLVLVTFNLLTMLCLRNITAVRAISPFLSTLMFIGCYLQCVATIIVIAKALTQYALLVTILCNVEFATGFMGLYLIVFTMVIRLARIFRIFTHFGKLGPLWSDKSLFVIIILFSVIPTILIIISTFVDRLSYSTDIIYDREQFPITAIERGYCSFNFDIIWVILAYAPLVVALAVLLFLAIQTRSIKRKDFKDTKKINIFIFTLTGSILLLILLYQMLRGLNLYSYSDLILGIAYLEICFLCQAIIFMPKLYPVLYRHVRGIPEAVKTNVHTSKDNVKHSPHTITRALTKAAVSMQY